VPSLAEHRLDVTDGRPAYRHLNVVPWRSFAVDRGHGLWLVVPQVFRIVAPAMAQIDATHVGDVELGSAGVTKDHELLVMRPAGPAPHVEQADPSRRVDVLAEVAVFPFREPQPVEMRTPHQTPDDHPCCGRVAEHPRHFGPGTVEQLIRIAAPVREQQQVAGL
jgi:hypothetical protein